MDEYPITKTNTIWTYHDYREIPSDGKVYQIVQGVLYMTPAPNFNHQEISGNIYNILRSFVVPNKLGKVVYSPIDVIFSQTDVVQPDLIFISNERKGLIKDHGIAGPPDLVVEVISPSTQKLDETVKYELYDVQGVYEYLLVYPEKKQIVQHSREGGKLVLQGTFDRREQLSLHSMDLTVDLAEVFPAEST